VSERAVAPARPARPALPLWPLVVMFGLVPLWWVLGVFFLAWPLFGVLLMVLLLARSTVSLPAGSGWWLLFAGLAAISVVRLDRASALLTFGLRLGYVVTAFVVCLYVYTALREQADWQRVFRPLCLFWLGLVALGWLGVLVPAFSAATPVELLLPRGLAAAPYLHDIVHMHASEFNPLRAEPTERPSAPYAYTNSWGSAYSVAVPCVVGYLLTVPTGPLRVLLLGSLPLSLVPAFLTLNRGMFIGLGVALALVGLRALTRGHVRVVASVVGVGVLGAAMSVVIPVQDLIERRVSASGTTADRSELYAATIRAVARSPLLGYGAPTAVDTTSAQAPLGTQGQLWQVMYSHGLPALVCFLCWFLVVARRLAPAVSAGGLWLSAVPVVALTQTPFYGFTDPNLSVIFYAAGLALAAVDGPVNRPPAAGRGTGPAAPRRPAAVVG
jgi:hypothetical protein